VHYKLTYVTTDHEVLTSTAAGQAVNSEVTEAAAAEVVVRHSSTLFFSPV